MYDEYENETGEGIKRGINNFRKFMMPRMIATIFMLIFATDITLYTARNVIQVRFLGVAAYLRSSDYLIPGTYASCAGLCYGLPGTGAGTTVEASPVTLYALDYQQAGIL